MSSDGVTLLILTFGLEILCQLSLFSHNQVDFAPYVGFEEDEKKRKAKEADPMVSLEAAARCPRNAYSELLKVKYVYTARKS